MQKKIRTTVAMCMLVSFSACAMNEDPHAIVTRARRWRRVLTCCGWDDCLCINAGMACYCLGSPVGQCAGLLCCLYGCNACLERKPCVGLRELAACVGRMEAVPLIPLSNEELHQHLVCIGKAQRELVYLSASRQASTEEKEVIDYELNRCLRLEDAIFF